MTPDELIPAVGMTIVYFLIGGWAIWMSIRIKIPAVALIGGLIIAAAIAYWCHIGFGWSLGLAP